jgi:tRNA nucleotidyltransferase (CCA-adding enzyme)
MVKLFETSDAFRRPERFAELLTVCEADARGRTGLESQPYPQAAYLQRALAAAAAVSLPPEERAGLPGPAIGEEIRRRRLEAIRTEKARGS